MLERLYRELGKSAGFFSRALRLEAEELGRRYAPALAAAEASICPAEARLLAEDMELEVFARAFRDRVKYAVLLGLYDPRKADELTKRALRGDSSALRALLKAGADVRGVDLGPALPRLKEEFNAMRRAAGKVFVTAARGAIREAAAYVKYAEVYPYAGAGVEHSGYVFYAVAGVGVDHVYLFRVANSLDKAKKTALAEADVAAEAFGKPRKKVHIYVPGRGIYSALEAASDPTPRFKAFESGECRPGPHCAFCEYKDVCGCAATADVPRHRHAVSSRPMGLLPARRRKK